MIYEINQPSDFMLKNFIHSKTNMLTHQHSWQQVDAHLFSVPKRAYYYS